MNRGQLLAMLSSAGALAGCSAPGATRALTLGPQRNVRSIRIDVSRRSVQFPIARPDGVPIPAHANYFAAEQRVASVPRDSTQIINPICTQDSCGGGGGGGGVAHSLTSDSTRDLKPATIGAALITLRLGRATAPCSSTKQIGRTMRPAIRLD